MGRHRSRAAVGVGLLAVGLIAGACSARMQATGVVIAVDGALNDVESFTVRTTDGDDLTFRLAPDADLAFPPAHIREHLVSATPVVVEWRKIDGDLEAVSLGDADGDDHRLGS